jgi:hypothetical protein
LAYLLNAIITKRIISKRRFAMKKRIFLMIGIMVILSVFVIADKSMALTYQDLKDLQTYQIDDKLFYNFFYSSSASGGASAIDADGVTVNPINTPLNPGFAFNAAWIAGAGQTVDSFISFSVKVLPGGGPIADVSAGMVGVGVKPNGVASVAENIYMGEAIDGTKLIGTIYLFYDGGIQTFDKLDIDPTLGPITVAKDIAVAGNAGSASISYVTNQFSEIPVPEPTALLLLGCGLVGLVAVRKKFKK